MEIKLVISEKGKSYVAKSDDVLVGRKIGDKIKGDLVGAKEYELEITGGSDSAGFPMDKSVEGSGRRRILITVKNGNKVRVTVRGNTISNDTAQVNLKVLKSGKDSLDKLFPKEEKKE